MPTVHSRKLTAQKGAQPVETQIVQSRELWLDKEYLANVGVFLPQKMSGLSLSSKHLEALWGLAMKYPGATRIQDPVLARIFGLFVDDLDQINISSNDIRQLLQDRFAGSDISNETQPMESEDELSTELDFEDSTLVLAAMGFLASKLSRIESNLDVVQQTLGLIETTLQRRLPWEELQT